MTRRLMGGTASVGKRVFILGGYGQAGRHTAALLLAKTDHKIVLAGRSIERLEVTRDSLTQPKNIKRARVEIAPIDAADTDALRQAVTGAQVCCVMVPSNDLGESITEACGDRGVDIVDISLWPGTAQVYEEQSAAFEEAQIAVVHQAGVLPGLPSLLVRHAAQLFTRTDSVVLGEAVKIEPSATLAAAEELLAVLKLSGDVFRDGKWRKPRERTLRINFGEPIGAERCYPFGLRELNSLPGELGITELGAYSGGLGGWADLILMLSLGLRLNRNKRTLRWSAKRLLKAIKRSAKPPFGTCLQVEASGLLETGFGRARLRVCHEHPYEATAISVVACLNQLLDEDGPRRPGTHLMGHLLDTERAIADMVALGLEVDVQVEEV